MLKFIGWADEKRVYYIQDGSIRVALVRSSCGVWGWVGGEGALAKLPAIASSGNYALAQIVGDRTLPSSSCVTMQDNIRVIAGGTPAGSNLFHSFELFSVPTGGITFFNHAI